jgi:hypothetical protein
MPIFILTIALSLLAAFWLGLNAHANSPAIESSSWDTDFGSMILRISADGTEVTGDYPQYSGQIFGKITPDKHIEAMWVQPTSKRRCATPQHGSHHWGRVQWQVVQGEYLQGAWAYCDEIIGAGGPWNGGKPSIGRDFAKLFSTVIGVAAQVGGSYIGGGVGGQLAGMAINQASGNVQSAIEENAYTPPSENTEATTSSPDYPSARRGARN